LLALWVHRIIRPPRIRRRTESTLPIPTLIIIEAALVAFFVLGYILWRRNRSGGRDPGDNGRPS
jgi:hypothetical protein